MPTVAEELEELRRKAVTKSNADKLKNARGFNTPTDVEEALKQKAQHDKEAKKQAADILHSFNEAKQVDQDSDMRLKQTAQKREDQEKKKRAADILHSFNDAKASAVVVAVPKKLAPHMESGKEGGAESGEQAGTQQPKKPVAGEPGAEAPVADERPVAVVDNEVEKSRKSEAAHESELTIKLLPLAALETAAATEEANSAALTEEFDSEKMPKEPAIMEEPTATTKDTVTEEPVTEEPREELPIPEETNVATEPADGTDGEKQEAGIDAVLSPSHPHNDHKQHNEDHHHHQQQQQQPTETGESVDLPVLQEPADEVTAAVDEKLANEPVTNEPATAEETTVPVDQAAIEETDSAAFTSEGEQDRMKSPPKTTDVEQIEEKEPVQTSTTGATSPTDLGLDLCDPKAPEVETAHKSHRPIEMEKSVAEPVLEEPADEVTVEAEATLANEPVSDEPAPVDEPTVPVDEAAIEETKAAAFASKSEQDQMESPPKTTDVEQTDEKEPVQTSTSATLPTDLGLDLFDRKAPEVEMGYKSHQPIETGEFVEEPVLEVPSDERNATVEEKLANEAVANEPALVAETTAFVEAPAIEETKAAALTLKGEQDQMKSPKTTNVEQPKEKEPVQTSTTWPSDLGLDLCSPKDPKVEHAGCCVLL